MITHGSDSDYLTSSTTTCEPLLSTSRDATPHSSFLGERDHTSSCNVLSSTESAVTPPPTTLMISGINETQLQPKSKNIPPPPFSTPPKLKSVEQVMSDVPGSDVASLRLLTTALARNAILRSVWHNFWHNFESAFQHCDQMNSNSTSNFVLAR